MRLLLSIQVPTIMINATITLMAVGHSVSVFLSLPAPVIAVHCFWKAAEVYFVKVKRIIIHDRNYMNRNHL